MLYNHFTSKVFNPSLPELIISIINCSMGKCLLKQLSKITGTITLEITFMLFLPIDNFIDSLKRIPLPCL